MYLSIRKIAICVLSSCALVTGLSAPAGASTRQTGRPAITQTLFTSTVNFSDYMFSRRFSALDGALTGKVCVTTTARSTVSPAYFRVALYTTTTAGPFSPTLVRVSSWQGFTVGGNDRACFNIGTGPGYKIKWENRTFNSAGNKIGTISGPVTVQFETL